MGHLMQSLSHWPCLERQPHPITQLTRTDRAPMMYQKLLSVLACSSPYRAYNFCSHTAWHLLCNFCFHFSEEETAIPRDEESFPPHLAGPGRARQTLSPAWFQPCTPPALHPQALPGPGQSVPCCSHILRGKPDSSCAWLILIQHDGVESWTDCFPANEQQLLNWARAGPAHRHCPGACCRRVAGRNRATHQCL